MTNQLHTPQTVATKLLDLATEDENNTLSPMQVLKLVYLCHGWMLGIYGRPLIDVQVEAWKYGPVIPTLYHSVKHHKSMPVTLPIKGTDNTAEIDELQTDIIKQVYAIYGRKTAIELSRITHMPKSPWERVWQPGHNGIAISNDLIEDHYRKLADSGSK